MPTLFVGLHAALAVLIALFGLSFIADPCGGGGDLCLGGVLGLTTLGFAGLILVGLAIWAVVRRASPLLVMDALFVAVGGYIVLATATYQAALFLLGAQLVVIVGSLGGVAAGRAVAAHRIEPLLVIAVLVAFVAFEGTGAIAVLVLGLAALGVGWLLSRSRPRRVSRPTQHGSDCGAPSRSSSGPVSRT